MHTCVEDLEIAVAECCIDNSGMTYFSSELREVLCVSCCHGVLILDEHVAETREV